MNVAKPTMSCGANKIKGGYLFVIAFSGYDEVLVY